MASSDSAPARVTDMFKRLLLTSMLLPGAASGNELASRLDAEATALATSVVGWRRDLHQHPELGNREFRTAEKVAAHLRSLGLEVETGVAHTGVVALLEGGRPGPRLALRADMDALPVTEQVDLPFKSTATTQYRGETVGVMHACGHDAHTAILMGAAAALARHRAELPGSVLFIFQPAEEGAPDGEKGGAALMLEEGVFARYKPEAIVGLHVFSTLRAGQVGVRGGPTMAESDRFRIVLRGVQTHGAKPWAGIDPVVVGAQLVMNLQTVVSRRINTVESPAVLTVGAFRAGNRHNIIPQEAELLGTVRSFDDETREAIFADIRRITEHTAAAAGATAEVAIERQTNVNRNDEALEKRLRPALVRAVGEDNTKLMPLQTVAEDFGYFAAEVPGFFFFVGSTPPDQDPRKAPANHSPLYFVDERALDAGLRSMLSVTARFLSGE
jgi:amidohydrolase